MAGKWLHSKAASYFDSVFSMTPCSLPFMTFREGRMCVHRKLVMMLLLSLLELTIQVRVMAISRRGTCQRYGLSLLSTCMEYQAATPQEGIK